MSRSMWFVEMNPRYQVRSIKFFILVSPTWGSDGVVVGKVLRLRYVDEDGNEYTEFQVRVEGLRWADVKPVPYPVDLGEFVRPSYRSVVDLDRVRLNAYNRLRNVYNSLRYCRVQLRYGRQPENWWLVKKLVFLVNGFERTRWEDLPVSAGLRTAFKVYVTKGLKGLMSYVSDRYLRGLNPLIWSFMESYMCRRWVL